MRSIPSAAIVQTARATNYPALLEQIRGALIEAQTLEDSITVLKATRALEEVVKCGEVSREIEIEASELRIRWERQVGMAMKDAPKNRGAKGSLVTGNTRIPVKDTTPTYDELKIGKSQATRFRTLASTDEEVFEKTIAHCAELARQKPTQSVGRSLSTNAVVRECRKRYRGDKPPAFSPIIKPSDNWNFSRVEFDRLNDNQNETWGYIPGDLYANCLWYYTKDGDKVVAPMAGSGMIRHVWENRDKWMVGDRWEIDLHMMDLNPRGKYKSEIRQNDLTKQLPETDVDYIVMDVPYFGMVRGQYSENDRDVANLKNYDEWLGAMEAIARNCYNAQKEGGHCTVISPNYRDTASHSVVPVVWHLGQNFEKAGYRLKGMCHSSRRIQQSQTPAMAQLNNQAKKQKLMLTDISTVLTFFR